MTDNYKFASLLDNRNKLIQIAEAYYSNENKLPRSLGEATQLYNKLTDLYQSLETDKLRNLCFILMNKICLLNQEIIGKKKTLQQYYKLLQLCLRKRGNIFTAENSIYDKKLQLYNLSFRLMVYKNSISYLTKARKYNRNKEIYKLLSELSEKTLLEFENKWACYCKKGTSINNIRKMHTDFMTLKNKLTVFLDNHINTIGYNTTHITYKKVVLQTKLPRKNTCVEIEEITNFPDDKSDQLALTHSKMHTPCQLKDLFDYPDVTAHYRKLPHVLFDVFYNQCFWVLNMPFIKLPFPVYFLLTSIMKQYDFLCHILGVGGLIRDSYYQNKVNDYDFLIDISLGSLMEYLTERFPNTKVGYRGQAPFVSLVVFMNNENHTLKVDFSSISDAPLINILPALHLDCQQRDFTINALYWDFARNIFIDLFGGYSFQHLMDKILWPIFLTENYHSDPAVISRMVRFKCQNNMTLSPELNAIYKKLTPCFFNVPNGGKQDLINKNLDIAEKTGNLPEHFKK